MKCKDIQDRLVDYVCRELGAPQSDLIRRHLEGCEDCKQAAKEITDSLSLLRKGAETQDPVPEHLSDERRARITRSYRHPAIHWIETHHIIVSIIAATVLVIVALTAVALIRNQIETPSGGVNIWIDGGPPPEPEDSTKAPPAE